MTSSDLNAFLLRALRRKSPMTESELIFAAQNVFQTECRTSDVTERLRDLDNKRLITGADDGVTETTWALTKLGQHKAKEL